MITSTVEISGSLGQGHCEEQQQQKENNNNKNSSPFQCKNYILITVLHVPDISFGSYAFPSYTLNNIRPITCLLVVGK